MHTKTQAENGISAAHLALQNSYRKGYNIREEKKEGREGGKGRKVARVDIRSSKSFRHYVIQ